MFARRRPLLPSFLSLVTVTKVLRYFNVMIFSCRYQPYIDNQMVNIFHKWSLLNVTSDKSRLSNVFHRELSIILSHVSVSIEENISIQLKQKGDRTIRFRGRTIRQEEPRIDDNFKDSLSQEPGLLLKQRSIHRLFPSSVLIIRRVLSPWLISSSWVPASGFHVEAVSRRDEKAADGPKQRPLDFCSTVFLAFLCCSYLWHLKAELRHSDHDPFDDHKNAHPNRTLRCRFLRRNPCLIEFPFNIDRIFIL